MVSCSTTPQHLENVKYIVLSWRIRQQCSWTGNEQTISMLKQTMRFRARQTDRRGRGGGGGWRGHHRWDPRVESTRRRRHHPSLGRTRPCSRQAGSALRHFISHYFRLCADCAGRQLALSVQPFCFYNLSPHSVTEFEIQNRLSMTSLFIGCWNHNNTTDSNTCILTYL